MCGSSLFNKDAPRGYTHPLTGGPIDTTYLISTGKETSTSFTEKDTLPQTGIKPISNSVAEKKPFQSVGSQTRDTNRPDIPEQHEFYKKADKTGDVEKTAKTTLVC